MARYLRNRSSKEIIAFLIAKGFEWANTVGDDEIYIKPDHKFVVKVTKNQKSTPIGITQYIKKMSGYNSKEWVNWWKENGYWRMNIDDNFNKYSPVPSGVFMWYNLIDIPI